MLDAFPRAKSQSAETTIEAYLELTADIPLGFLVVACKRLMFATTFLPTIAEIRQRAATEIIRAKRKAEGKDPDRGDRGVVNCPEHQIDHWIARAREVEGLPEIPAATSEVYLPAPLEAQLRKLIESQEDAE